MEGRWTAWEKNALARDSMFYGAMLLTAGSLGLRLVQMAFQVYISGVMGAAGLGRMQLIMTIGGFCAILPPAVYGLL